MSKEKKAVHDVADMIEFAYWFFERREKQYMQTGALHHFPMGMIHQEYEKWIELGLDCSEKRKQAVFDEIEKLSGNGI